jgi:orotidine-5'-phosphate decarboxylase
MNVEGDIVDGADLVRIDLNQVANFEQGHVRMLAECKKHWPQIFADLQG